MSEQAPQADWPVGKEGPLDVSVLFIDLVSSSEFASIMGLREYSEYVETFHRLCIEQCRYYFEEFLGGEYRGGGLDYDIKSVGDELAVFMHTRWPWDDVFQLICLAITLKCGWLGTPLNAARIANGMATAELAAGLHHGKIWARRTEEGFSKQGFAINVAKRVESASREGDRFRIFVSDPAFKLVNRRMRSLICGPRRVAKMKGVVVPIGVYEIIESFVNVRQRLAPQFAEGFEKIARKALETNSFDLWIHSCLQVWAEERNGHRVTDEYLDLCDHVLKIDPRNPVALLHAAQAHRERDDLETARLYYEDLTRFWPTLADGWLELGRTLKEMGETRSARRAILQAFRHGVGAEEESLPEVEPSVVASNIGTGQ